MGNSLIPRQSIRYSIVMKTDKAKYLALGQIMVKHGFVITKYCTFVLIVFHTFTIPVKSVISPFKTINATIISTQFMFTIEHTALVVVARSWCRT